MLRLFSCEKVSDSISWQAAPVAAENTAAEVPEPSPETQETGEAKAGAAEEAKEAAEASYAEN